MFTDKENYVFFNYIGDVLLLCCSFSLQTSRAKFAKINASCNIQTSKLSRSFINNLKLHFRIFDKIISIVDKKFPKYEKISMKVTYICNVHAIMSFLLQLSNLNSWFQEMSLRILSRVLSNNIPSRIKAGSGNGGVIKAIILKED